MDGRRSQIVPLMSSFFYVACQSGAEAFVKADLAERDPDARLAFSRPGFLTFKTDRDLDPTMPKPTVFARSWGVCWGSRSDPASALELLRSRVGGDASSAVVHAFARDAHRAGEWPGGEREPWDRDDAVAEHVRALGHDVAVNGVPSDGQLVLDVVEVDAGSFWVGAHRHDARHRPTPGGRPPFAEAPPEAPSRVWHKIEEALWWSGLPLRQNDFVLDIGCAPGGGTWNLLQRGARVVGIDPGEVATIVLDHPRFEHLRVAFEHVELPQAGRNEVRWVVFDVNLSPMLTLKFLARLGRSLPNLQGALVTLKLNKLEHVARIDWMLDKVRQMGLEIEDATQLYHNRQEICVYARRR